MRLARLNDEFIAYHSIVTVEKCSIIHYSKNL